MQLSEEHIASRREIVVTIFTAIIFVSTLLSGPNHDLFGMSEYPFNYIMYSIGIYYVTRIGSLVLEEESIMKIIMQIAAIINGFVFCVFCTSWYACLLLWFCIDNIKFRSDALRKTALVSFPAIGYLMIRGIGLYRSGIALLLVYCILFLFISSLILYMDIKFYKYQTNQNKMVETLSLIAINELTQKNLNRELAIKNYLTDRNARLEERDRISLDIHNSVGHTVTTAIMALDAAEMLYEVSPEKARTKTVIAKERMHESLDSIRRAVRMLDEIKDKIVVNDFWVTLISMLEQFMLDTDIKIRYNIHVVSKDIIIDRKHTLFLRGAVQELLTNGVKHANANAFIVLLNCDSNHIKLTVSDNGKKFALLSKEEQDRKFAVGFGLKKISEYVNDCGGIFHSSYEEGFHVEITIPILN